MARSCPAVAVRVAAVVGAVRCGRRHLAWRCGFRFAAVAVILAAKM